MFNIQTIENVSDCSPLYLPHSLYLKPMAKMHISVGLPINKTGKSISNLEIMEKLSAELKPDKFLVLKVSKSTINCIRFEAELDEHKRIRSAIGRLDGVSLRLSGFSESFRVRCTEAKDEFPTRHDWDSYFRDARNMDEMKAGERPDTIYLTHLPIRWFCPRHAENDDNPKPSESIFKRIFEKYGRVRSVDIPICDPYRPNMNADISGLKTFSFEQDVLFEGYVQFEEYAGFVRAMDEFRGMKLVRKFIDKTQSINIYVSFDKTKHLSEAQMVRRERVRKRLQAKAKAADEERERAKKDEQLRLERERQKEEQIKLEELEKQRQREEKRKEKHLKKIQERGQVEISQKIRVEERKLQIAQRKLESIRILEQLFDRIKMKHTSKHSRRQHNYDDIQNQQRERLVEKYKSATEKLLEDQRKIVEDIKSKTPLMGLLKMKTKRNHNSSDDDDDADDKNKLKKNIYGAPNHHHDSQQKQQQQQAAINGGTPISNAAAAVNMVNNTLNPFKAVAALAAAAVPNSAAAGAPPYSAEAASEWMKSLSMFPYGVPSVFPGVPALYRPPPPFPVSSNYRGFAPRPRGGRMGRGRGRGRGGGFEGGHSSYYSKHYDDDRYEDENVGYYKSSRGRHRSRSSSYSRSRSRSRGRSRRRSHSHSRSRSHYHKSSYSSRSRNRSRSHSHSRSRSKSTTQRTNKKLVSTRRSRTSSDYSRSPSRSYRSKRSWSRRGGRRSDRHTSRSRSRTGSPSIRPVVLETDELVRSAEHIKTTIENKTKERMREEVREIKKNFRTQKYSTESTTTMKVYEDYVELKASNEDINDRKDEKTSEDRELTKSKHSVQDEEEEEEEEDDEKDSYRRRSTSTREEIAT